MVRRSTVSDSYGFRVPPVSRLSAKGIVLSETMHAPGAVHASHAHANAYFDVVLAGSHVEHFDGGRFELGRSSLAFRPAHWEHRNRVSGAGVRCLNLELGDEWLRRNDVARWLPDRPLQLVDPRLRAAMLRLRSELEIADAFSPLAIEGIALELVTFCLRSRSPGGTRPPWLAIVQRMLAVPAGHLHATPSVADLAAAAGVHPSHLGRTVRRHLGGSVGELLRARRLSWAVERIVESADPLSAIAVESGFCDQAHLTRVMRRVLGVTPGGLRRERRARG